MRLNLETNLSFPMSQGRDHNVNDLLVIGTQEGGPEVQLWRGRLMEAAGSEWKHVASEYLLGITIVVLAHRRIGGRLSCVQTSSVATGQFELPLIAFGNLCSSARVP